MFPERQENNADLILRSERSERLEGWPLARQVLVAHPDDAPTVGVLNAKVARDGRRLSILRCADGSYYCGTARLGLEQRAAEHNSGQYDGYTATRRPVTLVYSEWFERITDAIAAERQVKGWSRAKKEALIRGDFGALRHMSKRSAKPPLTREHEFVVILRDATLRVAPQDEVLCAFRS